MDAFDFTPYDRLVAAHLQRWNLPPEATARVINHSENITYRIDLPGDAPRILRLHRPGYHTDAAIRSELAWLAALHADGVVRTAPAIPGRDGDVLQILASADLPEPRRAVLFGFLDGREPADTDIGATMHQLGAVTARLHQHARAWHPPATFHRQHWDFSTMLGHRPIWGDWRAAPGIEAETATTLERLVTTLETRLRRFTGPTHRGLIHADLRAANLLVGGPEVAVPEVSVIDFDDCGIGWFLYDYGTVMTFMEHNPAVPDWTASWIEGYRSIAPLARDDEAELPTFLMLRRMMAVAWIGSHGETELAQQLGRPFVEASATLADTYLQTFT